MGSCAAGQGGVGWGGSVAGVGGVGRGGTAAGGGSIPWCHGRTGELASRRPREYRPTTHNSLRVTAGRKSNGKNEWCERKAPRHTAVQFINTPPQKEQGPRYTHTHLQRGIGQVEAAQLAEAGQRAQARGRNCGRAGGRGTARRAEQAGRSMDFVAQQSLRGKRCAGQTMHTACTLQAPPLHAFLASCRGCPQALLSCTPPAPALSSHSLSHAPAKTTLKPTQQSTTAVRAALHSPELHTASTSSCRAPHRAMASMAASLHRGGEGEQAQLRGVQQGATGVCDENGRIHLNLLT